MLEYNYQVNIEKKGNHKMYQLEMMHILTGMIQ